MNLPQGFSPEMLQGSTADVMSGLSMGEQKEGYDYVYLIYYFFVMIAVIFAPGDNMYYRVFAAVFAFFLTFIVTRVGMYIMVGIMLAASITFIVYYAQNRKKEDKK